MSATTKKIQMARKVAFQLGIARYFHQHDVPAELRKMAEDGDFQRVPMTKTANPLGLLALAPAVGSFVGGRALGHLGGQGLGLATDISPETLAEREYELAAQATQQLIDEIKAKQHNQAIRAALAAKEGDRVQNPLLEWHQ